MSALLLTSLGKTPMVLAIAAGLALGAALVGLQAVGRLDAMMARQVQAAVNGCDARWRSQIDVANLKLAAAAAAQASEAMRLNGELAAARDAARQAQTELETANAALPDGDRGGLDRARVRLLNRP